MRFESDVSQAGGDHMDHVMVHGANVWAHDHPDPNPAYPLTI